MTMTAMHDLPPLVLGQPTDFTEWLNSATVVYPDWVKTLQRQGGTDFAVLGLPTTQHEDWRQTSLATLRKLEFRPAAEVTVTAAVVQGFEYAGLECDTLVFVNGRFQAEFSSGATVPAEVIICTLQEALVQHAELAERYFGRYLETGTDAFAALNTAAFGDGVFVYVPAGVKVERPIHLVNLTVADEDSAQVFFPRNLLVVEDSAELTLIEDYGCTDEDTTAVYLTNAVTEFVIGKNAKAHHYFIERESRGAFNVSTLRVRQADDSEFESHSALLGAGLVRNNVLPRLDGTNCRSLLNGIYFGDGEQRIDNFMRVEHNNTNGGSRQYYKGILTGSAQATFTGRIVVAKPAQQTDAVQSNQNLLLSEGARAHTKPQLEIYADDVKCTHGATIGELDEQALFYLRARGISESAARALLIHAFALESLERMTLEPVREALESLLIERLPQGEALRRIL